MKSLMPYLWIGLGGFVGANARHLVSNLAARLAGVGFPYGTFFINVSGSFLLGVILTILAERTLPFSQEIRLAVAVGFLGAYTTFSTFEYETGALLKDGEWLFAGMNIVLSVVIGFVALKLGEMLAKTI